MQVLYANLLDCHVSLVSMSAYIVCYAYLVYCVDNYTEWSNVVFYACFYLIKLFWIKKKDLL